MEVKKGSLCDVIREAMETTGVKGIPRIIKSETKALRYLWAIGVTLLLSMTIYQAYKLIKIYASFPSTTLISQGYVFGANNFSVNFPDVTVCNLNPISASNEQETMLAVETFYKLVNQVTSCSNCTASDRERLTSIRAQLLTPDGFYQYLGTRAPGNISQQPNDDFVLDCSWMELQGVATVRQSCAEVSFIRHWVSSSHFRCFTVSQKHINRMLVGLTLVLHLDSQQQRPVDTFFDVTSYMGLKNGVRLAVHPAGTTPMFDLTSVEVAAGMATLVNFHFQHWEKLPPPHGLCSADLPQLNDSLGRPVTYDYSVCFASCIENRVLSQCGCRDSSSVLKPESQKRREIPFCQDIRHGRVNILNLTNCMVSSRLSAMQDCTQKCPIACNETSVFLAVSHSQWPSHPIPNEFFNYFLANKELQKLFPGGLTRNSNLSNYENLVRSYTEITIVRNKFLKFQVQLDSVNYIHLKDVVVMTIENLTSALGGVLNLWSGITAVFFIEVLDLIIRLVIANNKRMKPEIVKPPKRTEKFPISSVTSPSSTWLHWPPYRGPV